jgi:hypothetical protein
LFPAYSVVTVVLTANEPHDFSADGKSDIAWRDNTGTTAAIMGITRHDLKQAYAQHKAQYGGSKEDYFALLYLTREFETPSTPWAAIQALRRTSSSMRVQRLFS